MADFWIEKIGAEAAEVANYKLIMSNHSPISKSTSATDKSNGISKM